LDEIGLDGRRLSISNVSLQDEDASGRIIQETLAELKNLGPNPAA
jgi:coenzyme F420-reducing hydrogenase delta subunit